MLKATASNHDLQAIVTRIAQQPTLTMGKKKSKAKVEAKVDEAAQNTKEENNEDIDDIFGALKKPEAKDTPTEGSQDGGAKSKLKKKAWRTERVA
jgi:membrane protein involved in colicin uptake